VALDGAIPLQPAWALVYGALYVFLIVLPVLVVREPQHIRRTVWAYLSVWLTAYVCFLLYPTVAPRGDSVAGEGFAAWGLRFLYQADPPYNCFPSLHVAHSFVSAFACYRVHRGVGIGAMLCAALVAVSTLYSRQHYVLDVVAGALMAWAAYAVFLRGLSRESVSRTDQRLAPVFALGMLAVAGMGVVGAWVMYRVTASS
jgi:membrane-associated phospholipid phosphatase